MIRENAVLIAFSIVGASLILSLLKFGAGFGIPWYWMLAPIWLPLLILVLPWIITMALLWVHERTRGE